MTKRKPVLIQGRGPRRPTPPIIFKTKLVPEGPTKIFLETGAPRVWGGGGGGGVESLFSISYFTSL